MAMMLKMRDADTEHSFEFMRSWLGSYRLMLLLEWVKGDIQDDDGEDESLHP